MSDPNAADAAAGDVVALNVVNGNPTAAELAAVTVVLEKILEELDVSAAESSVTVSAWQRSQRPIRAGLARGTSVWRGFSA